MRNIKSIIFL